MSYTAAIRRSLIIHFVFVVLPLLLSVVAGAAVPQWPAAVGSNRLSFTFLPDISDEFNTADTGKWSLEGDLHPQTKCPLWNGPAPLYLDPSAAYVSVANGAMQVSLQSVDNSYFTSREYYCIADSSHPRRSYCNWDTTMSAGKCTTNQDTIYNDWMCKKAPYCLPAKQNLYQNLVAGYVVGKQKLKYGYMEARVRAPPAASNTVAAVWTTSQYYDPPYDRVNAQGVYENPSLIRGRHWQEIDFAELPMSPALGNHYIPNVHLFADYDGRHTSSNPPGPIIQDSSIAGSQANSMHWNTGSAYQQSNSWDRAWNTFGVWWDENEIRFIVNGVERSRYKNRYIHQPQGIILSMLISTDWLGALPRTGRHVLKVDYIRAWSVKKSADVTANSSSIPGTRPLNDQMGVAPPPRVQWPAPGVTKMAPNSSALFSFRGKKIPEASVDSTLYRERDTEPQYRGISQFKTPLDQYNPADRLAKA